MKNKNGFGAVIDTRSIDEKLKDYKFEETVTSVAPVQWKEKTIDECRQFPIFNQNGSGSCVAQTEAKLMGITHFLTFGVYRHFSATHLYQRRANKPNAGMAGVDVHKIAGTGVTFEPFMPSQDMTDAQMDNAKMGVGGDKSENQFKISNYLDISRNGDIDTVASIIQQTGKGVMVWFYFDYNATEWQDIPVIKFPTLDLYGRDTARHSVTAIDFFLINGKKCLLIEDSWGVKYGKGGRRIITEDFFKARNFYGAYLLNFKTEEKPPAMQKPSYNFTHTLTFTPTLKYFVDVAKLQDVLKYEGLFPLNISSTGFYGAITAKAVLAFQKKYNVAPIAELDTLQGRLVGNKTLAMLNKLYGINK